MIAYWVMPQSLSMASNEVDLCQIDAGVVDGAGELSAKREVEVAQFGKRRGSTWAGTAEAKDL